MRRLLILVLCLSACSQSGTSLKSVASRPVALAERVNEPDRVNYLGLAEMHASRSKPRNSSGTPTQRRPVPRPAVPGGVPTPGSNRAIGQSMAAERHWTGAQWDCLDELWGSLESGWNQFARNRSSGAYGIPQALPGSKMASAGADWQTNPATQISWGLGYIAGRYGTPCQARSARLAKGWY